MFLGPTLCAPVSHSGLGVRRLTFSTSASRSAAVTEHVQARGQERGAPHRTEIGRQRDLSGTDLRAPWTPTPPLSLCHLFVCYEAGNHQWTSLESDGHIHSDDHPVGIHPFAPSAMSDHSDELQSATHNFISRSQPTSLLE